MRKSAIAFGAATLLLASAPALADRDYRHMDRSVGPADSRATIDALERRDDELQRRSSANMRIGAVERRQIALQRDLIDDLIDRLERGEPVDHYAIDRAFEYPYLHGTYRG
jgi:hypothetical protein